jgi:AcrR family transcriptional regulator
VDCRTEREAKHVAVLRTAAQAFYEIGFHNTSLDDIARRLNVTKPTIHYYVRNKEKILFECVRIGLKMLGDVSNDVMGHGGSAYEELTAVMHRYAEIVTMDFGLCVIHVGEELRPPDRTRHRRGLHRPLVPAERRPQCPRHRGPVHRPADERPGQNQNIRGGP